MARNDFATGFLQGLYNSGVGNPEVQRQKQQDQQQQQIVQMQLNKQAADSGMMPAPQDAIHANISDYVKGLFFPGSNQGVNTSFVKNPNAASATLYQDPNSNDYSRTQMNGGLAVTFKSPEEAAKALETQSSKQKPMVTVVSDPSNSDNPMRIVPNDYKPTKPGEVIGQIPLSDAWGKVNAQTTAGARNDYFGAKSGQIGLTSATTIKDQLDPSNLSRGTVMGAAASSVKRAVNGLSLMNQGAVTKTILEATLGDIDSILTQAAATTEGRKMLEAPNFKKNLTDFKSFVSNAPDTVSVPANYVNIYRNILNDLGPISQKTVSDYVNRTAKLIRPSSLKFVTPEQFDSFKQEVLDSYNIQSQLGSAPKVNGKTSAIALPGGASYTVNP